MRDAICGGDVEGAAALLADHMPALLSDGPGGDPELQFQLAAQVRRRNWWCCSIGGFTV